MIRGCVYRMGRKWRGELRQPGVGRFARTTTFNTREEAQAALVSLREQYELPVGLDTTIQRGEYIIGRLMCD